MAALAAIASYLPERELTNEELASLAPKWTAQSIFDKTGIHTRHVAAADECASDLGVEAAQRLFKSGACNTSEIDYVLFCTQSPDYFLPATACLVQQRLGLPTTTGAIDVNQGCSGFVYSLSLAKGLIESQSANNILLITADTYSKHLHASDISTRVLFGDGASAALITAVQSDDDLIGPFAFGSDGAGAGNLIVKYGGMRCRAMVETGPGDRSGCLYMNGPEIFNFTLNRVPSLVSTLLKKSSRDSAEIDYFVFHQANRFMLDHLRQKLQIPVERFCINMDGYGNTVSSTIPMALELAMRRSEIRAGDLVMLVGFGVGYSWAGTLVRII
jgi:3-oxoacyl-[acyl-carrier-protein] synthase-3